MQRRHSIRHLLWRGGVAAVSHALMFTGLYPLRAARAARAARGDLGERRCARRSPSGAWRSRSSAAAAGRVPAAARRARPRPAADHRAARLRDEPRELRRRSRFGSRAPGSGRSFGFEYWTLGRTARGGAPARLVRRRGARGDRRGRRSTSSATRWAAWSRATTSRSRGGDGVVANLVTLGSPHAGTDVSAARHRPPDARAGPRLAAARSGSPRRRRRAHTRSRRSGRTPTRSCPRRSSRTSPGAERDRLRRPRPRRAARVAPRRRRDHFSVEELSSSNRRQRSALAVIGMLPNTKPTMVR